MNADGARPSVVTYEDFRDIGFGVLPVIEEGDPAPAPEHYARAADLQQQLEAGVIDWLPPGGTTR